MELQVIIVPLMIVNWMTHAYRSKPFQSIMLPLLLLAIPVLEVTAVILSVAILLSMCILLLIGERIERWSSLQQSLQRMFEHVFVGAPWTACCSIHRLAFAGAWSRLC